VGVQGAITLQELEMTLIETEAWVGLGDRGFIR
jgi:hypothetical protein